MSKKDASAFLEMLEKDKKFKSEFASVKTEEDLNKMKEMHHLTFTKKEFQEVFKEKYHKKLTPQDLGNVVAAGRIGVSAGINTFATAPEFFK